MENYGSEIGQKMRSAVKAKLVELGTGGSAGYIDDELPDYVMIMVANKRSKQQMINDLNLFLGSQTELFVTWLHEVLQKLQEVTLPASSAAASKKRKNTQRDETSNKKDKKDKKDKKSTSGGSGNSKRPTTDETENTTPPPLSTEADKQKHITTAKKAATVPAISSITEVFAEELLEKAKKSLDVSTSAAAQIKKGKGEQALQSDEIPDFDIPTISEISSTTGGGANSVSATAAASTAVSGNREKDLAELAAIQRKIYAAKKLLREIGEINDEMDSDDNDFLNLRDDGSPDELNEAGDLVEKPPNKSARPKSPIVFNAPTVANAVSVLNHPEKVCDSSDTTQQRGHTPLTPTDTTIAKSAPMPEVSRTDNRGAKQRSESLELVRKRPVHERLGMKPAEPSVPRERRPRQEKELYVPAFRRLAMDGSENRERERDALRGRDNNNRERSRDRDNRDRERARDFERGRHDDKPESRFRRLSTDRHAPTTVTVASTASSANSRHEKRRRTYSDEHKKPNGSVEPITQQQQQQQRHRIGSRVIVAPLRPTEPSDDEDMIDKPVNSVIKIKPRAPVSPSKQACKNLLLRAVAEAQRSTILSKPVAQKDAATAMIERVKVSARLGQPLTNDRRGAKLSLNRLTRNRLKHKLDGTTTTTNSMLLRRTAKNFVIEVERGDLLMVSDIEDAINIADESLSEQDAISVDGELNADEEAFSYNSKKPRRRNSLDEMLEADVDADVGDAVVDGGIDMSNTQFVVTLNDEKSLPKYKGRKNRITRSRSLSPTPKVSSSSSVMRQANVEASSTTRTRPSRSRSRDRHKNNHGGHGSIKARLSLKASSSLSPNTAARLSGRESSHSSLTSSTPPPRRTERIEVYRKPREIKKIIIKNDSEDEDATTIAKKGSPLKEPHSEHNHHTTPRHNKAPKRRAMSKEHDDGGERSTTPPLPPNIVKHRQIVGNATKASTSVANNERREHSVSPEFSPTKRKRTPIKFDLDNGVKSSNRDKHSDNEHSTPSKRRSKSRERDLKREDSVERRKISIRNAEARKYDNIPALSSVALDSAAARVMKPKERCKYHPNCTKQFCEFYHPTAPCKSFPNCKYADKCMYSHPKCKYDMSCTNIDCNFSHAGPRNPTQLQLTAPPLSSHVVPVQNYKSITVVPPPAVSNTMCRYYPNCNKVNCTFYHPKLCRFGKNCINKLECNFYHHDMQSSSKFKWVASVV